MQQQTKTLFATAVVIIILVLVSVWFMGRSKNPYTTPQATTTADNTTEVKPRSDVVVKQAEPTDTGKSLKLPAGFPTTIPVEPTNITESFSAFYQTHNTTQYTVGYTSSESVATKWDQYSAYMTQAGYTFLKDGTSNSRGTLLGTKDKDKLSIVITTKDNKTLVQITLLRQG